MRPDGSGDTTRLKPQETSSKRGSNRVHSPPGCERIAMPRRKTWREKLADDKNLPMVGRIEGKMTRRWGEGTMVIPAPREVDAVMRRVPRGKLTTINDIRGLLAKKHGTDIACPITHGIFAWIAAH